MKLITRMKFQAGERLKADSLNKMITKMNSIIEASNNLETRITALESDKTLWAIKSDVLYVNGTQVEVEDIEKK